MSYIDNFFNPEDVIGSPMYNGVPDYENFIPYVELYCIRFNETNVLIGPTGTTTNIGLDSTVVSFLGYVTQTGYYSTDYTNTIQGNPDDLFIDEGFGITDIDVNIKSSMVPTVDITFVDIKGSAMFNPIQSKNPTTNQTTGSKYAVLFDFPPPTFVLIMKGGFGKATRMVLHLLKVDTEFDSDTGNFIIKTHFVGKTFAPLSDLKLGWIQAAPYIGNSDFAVSDAKQDINHLYELKIIGEQLYDDLNNLVSTSTEQQKIVDINTEQEQLNDLINKITLAPVDPSLIQTIIANNEQSITGLQFVFDSNGIPNQVGTTRANVVNRKFYYYTIPKSNSTLLYNTYNVLNNFKTELFTSDFKNLTNTTTNPIIIYTLFGVNATDGDDTDECVLYFDYTDFFSKIINEKNSLTVQLQTIRNEILTKADAITRQSMGFLPTIGKITQIICDDIDIFFNKLAQAGDYNRNGLLKSNTINVLDNGAWPRVTMFQTINGVQRETAVYPGANEVLINNPAFANWKEVIFVEQLINAMLQQKIYEQQLDQIQQTQANGLTTAIPVNPLDSNNSLTYKGIYDEDSFLTNIFKRYVISTQYTYKGFWSDTYAQDRRLDIINYVVDSEIQNIINSGLDPKMINTLITTISNLFVSTNNLTNLDTYLTNNPNKYPKLNNYLRTFNGSNTASVDTINLNATTPLYSLNTNVNYQGLTDVSTSFSTSNIIDTTTIPPSDTPTQYLLSFVNGSAINNFLKEQGEKPLLTTNNLLYFQDFDYTTDQYKSDFLNLNYTSVNQIISSSIASVATVAGLGSTDNLAQFMFNQVKNGVFPKYIDTTTLFEAVIDSMIYPFYVRGGINDLFNGKFLYSGIIQMPNIFLYKIGKDCINGNPYNLSSDDQTFFQNFYDKFKANEQSLINSYNQVFNSPNPTLQDVQGSELITYLLTQNYIQNSSSFTFLTKSENNSISSIAEDQFFPLLQKRSNGLYTENLIPFDTNLLSTTNQTTRIDMFLNSLKNKLVTALNNLKNNNAKELQNLKSEINDTNLKTELYYSLKNLYERWIKGTESYSSKLYAYPYSNDTPLISKFKFVDRAYNDISNIAIVDFTSILERLDSPDGEVYGCLGEYLVRNQFEFFPLPNFIDWSSDKKDWSELFSLSETAEITTQPMFTCMYIGGNSSQLDDAVSTTDLTQPPDMNDNVFGFNINVGIQNQSVFKDIKLSTSEYKATGEALKLVDNIFKAKATNTPIPKAQNLFEVYENRSYSCGVTIPLGNMLIQPTQYFEIFNVPLFYGLYIILEVHHKMSSNNRLETSFVGSRIKRYITPLVTSPFTDVTGAYSPLSQFAPVAENNSSITALGGVVNTNVLTPNTYLVRNANAITQQFVYQKSDGSFIANPLNLQFTSFTIDTTNLGNNVVVDEN
jgi:hypothetical protein